MGIGTKLLGQIFVPFYIIARNIQIPKKTGGEGPPPKSSGLVLLRHHVYIHLGEGNGNTGLVKGFFYGHKDLITHGKKVVVV